MRTLSILSLIFIFSQMASAAIVSRVYNFTDGSILTATQLNNEFNNLVNGVNSIDNANIVTGANILPIKINSTIAGSGLNRSGSTGVLSVGVDDASIEISSNNLQIKALGVTTAKINTSAVTAAKIDSGAVTSGKIATGAVSEDNLGTGVVTETKIGGAAVTVNKIGSNAVTTAKIDTNAVTFVKMFARATSATATEGNVALSTSTGSNAFTTEEVLATASLVISTSNRPIFIGMINDSAIDSGGFVGSNNGITTIKFKIDGTTVSTNYFNIGDNNGGDSGGVIPCSSFFSIVTSTTGTKSVTVTGTGTASASVESCKLVAYEL